jgi:hypothetical protein
MTPSTPDHEVRAQIEAAKSYLRREGFNDVAEPPVQQEAFEHLHTITMTLAGIPRVLRLDYGWLSDHSAQTIDDELVGRQVARAFKGDGATLYEIRHGGVGHHNMGYPA